MADKQPEPEMIGITRIIEYYGPKEWIDSVIAHSRIPLRGVRYFGGPGKETDKSIRSGIVMWGELPKDETEEKPNQPLTFPMPGGKPS